MTEDFKEKLLKYLTGNIVEETGTDTPTYQPIQEYMNNLDVYIRNELDINNYSIKSVYQSKTNSNIVLLGNNSGTSFIIVLNEKLMPLACITKFSSDVNFNYFTGFNIDENGYFYCIETDNSTKRFLMLNNIAVADTTGEYIVKIRRSYSVPNSVNLHSSSYVTTKIIKAIGQSIYLILNTNGSTRYITKLTVNVGIENEWEDILMNGVNGVDQWASIDSEGNVLLKTINPGYPTGTYQYGIGVYFYNNGTESTQTYTDTTISGLEVRRANGIILNETTAYVSYKVSDTNNTYTKYMINMVNLITGAITNIYEETDVYGVYAGDYNPIIFQNVNGIILFKMTIIKDLTLQTFKIVAGRIDGDKVYDFILKNTLVVNSYSTDFFIATQNFNLLRYMVQFGDTVYDRNEIYKALGYNGEEYEAINCLVPDSVTINDEDGFIIFARDLYNKSINGNTTVSTVEIPNTFLNDVTIVGKQLYSETNLLMASDSTEITKNIYESLDINFFNTLTMVNANTQNEIVNIVGASRLNNSISDTIDYDSAKASKIRINYQDGSNKIFDCKFYPVGNYFRVKFTIYVDKEIINIDILSNDTNTIYQTIEGNFNIGNIYTITQDVRVE